MWLGVTAHSTAEWIANQLTEACGWEQVPRDLIRDRERCYGNVFIRRVRSLGIRDHPTSPRSPWQNSYAERLIGSIRWECLDHIVVFSTCATCGRPTWIITRQPARTCPCARMHAFNVEFSDLEAQPVLGGLHHQYVRIVLR
jgi:transposase InsO family protein